MASTEDGEVHVTMQGDPNNNVAQQPQLNPSYPQQQEPQQQEDYVADEEAVQRKALHEFSNYAHICRLLVELSPAALRQVFNGVHPPLNLTASLSKPQTLVQLKRLRTHRVLNEQQWEVLFPPKKTQASSENYDAVLLSTLLKSICHLSPPYPNGWTGVPVHGDRSMGADVIRLQWFRTLLATRPEQAIEDKDYRAYWKQISEAMERLGGAKCKIKADRMSRDPIKDERTQRAYVKMMQDWDNTAKEVEAAETKVEGLLRKRAEEQEVGQLSTSAAAAGVKLPSLDTPDTSEGPASTITTTTATLSTKRGTSRARTTSRSISRSSVGGKGGDMGALAMKPEELRLHERAVLLQFFKPLTETVNSDDVVPKLIQRGVLSHEEKNRINLAPRNSDRMKLIIEMIPKKTAQKAFDKFCDVIKYKYTSLYDQLVKAKQAPFVQDKPDETTLCGTALRMHYDETLARCSPIPWHPDVNVALQDYVLPWSIMDHQGRSLTPENLFLPHPKCEKPRRLLLEGASGSGKSLLCSHLAYQWSQRAITFRGRFKLVFNIDMKRASGDIVDTILDQCVSPGFDRSPTEMHSLIQSNQQQVLFILDGYENLPDIDSDIYDLIYKRLYPKSAVLLMMDGNFVTPSLAKLFDTKLVLSGLVADSQEALVKTYAELTHLPVETFTSLLTKVVHEYETTVRLLSLNPLFCLCMCVMVETRGSLDFTTLTSMLQAFLLALQRLFCKTNLLQMAGDQAPEELQILVTTVEDKAFQTLTGQRVVFPSDDLVRQFKDKMEAWFNVRERDIFRFGLLHSKLSTANNKTMEQCFFVNRILHEYMAARCLSRLPVEDVPQYKDLLLSEKLVSNVLPFYFGIQRGAEQETSVVSEVGDWLAALNKDKWRAQALPRSSSSSSSRSLLMQPMVGKMEGRVMDFQLTLACIQEVEGRKDVLEGLLESLPCRLYKKPRDNHSLQVIGGLSHVVRADGPWLTELELRLDHFGVYYENMYLRLADSIEKSSHLTSLKLHWSNEDFLALFLANVYGDNTSIVNLHMVDDSASAQDQISATLWSNLRSAGANMLRLKTLAFTECCNPSLVTSVVRHSPDNIESLYFNGCHLDLVGAQNLAGKIEKAKTLTTLSLSGTKVNRADFLQITLGIRLNKSLRELQLCDMDLDNASLAALAEALKFNGTLRKLDLSVNTLTDLSCKLLGQALNINKTILEVQLTNCNLSEDGVQILKRLKREKVALTGMDRRRKLNAVQVYSAQMAMALPSLSISPRTLVEDAARA